MSRLGRFLPLLVISLLLVSGCRPKDPAAAAPVPTIPAPIKLTPLSPGVHEVTATLPAGGGNVLYTIWIPKGAARMSARPLIVVLHYSGYNKAHFGHDIINELILPAFEDLAPIIIAPDARKGDWTSAENEKNVVWLTESVINTYEINPKKVLLTGYSMGGEGTWYLAGRHQQLFTAAMPVAGSPSGADLEWTIPVYAIHSREDTVFPLGPTQKQVDQLKARGAKVELKIVSGATHFQADKFVAPMREGKGWLKTTWAEK